LQAKDDSSEGTRKTPEAWVREKSLEMGFLDMAHIPLEGIDPGYQTYQNWIKDGHHHPLEYLARNEQLRKRPQNLEPGLISAFVFLHPYPKEKTSRMIARYAWGKDYHITLKEKLRSLSDHYEETYGPLSSQRICVDTAPILERSLAQRSGLGWIGKNGCLISRRHGSWLLISTWLTSLPASTAQDRTHGFHCGKCTRCLDLCPTDAFIKPGLLNADLCLSTQTIENRGVFPDKMIGKLDQQAFGCDICQEVCPWNRKHPLAVEDDFLPPLKDLLELPEPDFRDFFRKSPMERPTWAGLRRNFLVLSAERKDVPDTTILRHLQDDRQLIRETAKQVIEHRKSLNKTPNN
jgi:epoxyqueuosine reductase